MKKLLFAICFATILSTAVSCSTEDINEIETHADTVEPAPSPTVLPPPPLPPSGTTDHGDTDKDKDKG